MFGFRCKCNCKFVLKNTTSRHYMWRFIAGLSAVRNAEWADKIKTALTCFMTVPKYLRWRKQEQFKNTWCLNCAKTWEQRALGQNLLVLILKIVYCNIIPLFFSRSSKSGTVGLEIRFPSFLCYGRYSCTSPEKCIRLWKCFKTRKHTAV